MPPILRESAYGLGCTTWKCARVVLHYTQKKGVIGGVIRGPGACSGETMAVTFVMAMPTHATSLFSPARPRIYAGQRVGRGGGFPPLHAFRSGFLLFVITFVVLSAARSWLLRAEKAKGCDAKP